MYHFTWGSTQPLVTWPPHMWREGHRSHKSNDHCCQHREADAYSPPPLNSTRACDDPPLLVAWQDQNVQKLMKSCGLNTMNLKWTELECRNRHVPRSSIPSRVLNKCNPKGRGWTTPGKKVQQVPQLVRHITWWALEPILGFCGGFARGVSTPTTCPAPHGKLCNREALNMVKPMQSTLCGNTRGILERKATLIECVGYVRGHAYRSWLFLKC